MKAKMRRNFSGVFRCAEIGTDAWQIVQGEARELQIVLRGAKPAAARLIAAAPIKLGIEWLADAARLTVATQDGVATMQTVSAIVHEPACNLYENLPLAHFDDRAKKFWRRVFWLLQVPGGRYLLKYLA
jgi:hypothetical protein